jgi:hypothetical protein
MDEQVVGEFSSDAGIEPTRMAYSCHAAKCEAVVTPQSGVLNILMSLQHQRSLRYFLLPVWVKMNSTMFAKKTVFLYGLKHGSTC